MASPGPTPAPSPEEVARAIIKATATHLIGSDRLSVHQGEVARLESRIAAALTAERARAETAERERDEALPWKLFYGDGLTLGQVVERCGGTVYTYSPWLTAPLVRAASEAGDAALARAEKAKARAEKMREALERVERIAGNHYRPNVTELWRTAKRVLDADASLTSLRPTDTAEAGQGGECGR